MPPLDLIEAVVRHSGDRVHPDYITDVCSRCVSYGWMKIVRQAGEPQPHYVYKTPVVGAELFEAYRTMRMEAGYSS